MQSANCEFGQEIHWFLMKCSNMFHIVWNHSYYQQFILPFQELHALFPSQVMCPSLCLKLASFQGHSQILSWRWIIQVLQNSEHSWPCLAKKEATEPLAGAFRLEVPWMYVHHHSLHTYWVKFTSYKLKSVISQYCYRTNLFLLCGLLLGFNFDLCCRQWLWCNF